MVLDTARADRLPCYGYARDTTPHVCALARDGILYRDARSAAPWTLPAHASLFLGVPPGRHGVHWGPTGPETRRPVAEGDRGRLLARRLGDAGYTTVGVSNNPWVARGTGLADGFDHFVEVWEERERFRAEYPRWPERWKATPNVDGLSSGKALVLTKMLFEEEAVESPYFLFLSFVEPHMPYKPAKELVGRFGGDVALAEEMRRSTAGALELDLIAGATEADAAAFGDLYDEELFTADRAIGLLFEWLEARGDFADALVVVTSDHGEHLGEGGRWSHQLSMEQELLRIPLVVRLPGGRGGGRVVRETVSLMDLYPTLLAAAGVEDQAREREDLPRLAVDLLAPPVPGGRAVLAESYYSDDYLEQLHERNPGFDVDAHRVVRRTWFVDGAEYRFEDGRPVRSPPGGERDVSRMQRAYEETVRDRQAGARTPAGVSEKTLEELRSLGYAE